MMITGDKELLALEAFTKSEESFTPVVLEPACAVGFLL